MKQQQSMKDVFVCIATDLLRTAATGFSRKSLDPQ